MATTDYEIKLDTGGLVVKAGAVKGALGGLEQVLTRITRSITGAFAVSELGEYLHGAAEAGGFLQKQLLVLRLALGKLEAAIGRAVAPIGQVFLPLVTKAVYAATRLANAAARIFAALFGGTALLEGISTGAEAAEKSISGLGKGVRRSVADFDELERLAAPTGSGGTAAADTAVQHTLGQLDLLERMIVSKIETLLEPLKRIDLSPAIEAFDNLKAALEPLTRELFAGLEWGWYNLLVPLAQWTAEHVLPAFLDAFSAALDTLGTIIDAIKPHVLWLWENLLLPILQWTGGKILEILAGLKQRLEGISQWIGENSAVVEAMTKTVGVFLAIWAGSEVTGWLARAVGLGSFFEGLISTVTKVIAAVGLLSSGFGELPGAAENGWGGIQRALVDAPEWIRKNILDAFTQGMKKSVNGSIGFLNSLLSAATAAVNRIVACINGIHFTVPDWVPLLGGESFGFRLSTVHTPQIPYLARGAVLPANKPFMAVVGDQKHGTNIEAPLSTIQEAVALVMNDQISAMMAGFEALLEENRALRQTVEGIEVGDSVIGQAAARYNRKMAVVKGGL